MCWFVFSCDWGKRVADVAQYLDMPLSELVSISISMLEERIPQLGDAGARALGEEVLKELKMWRQGESIMNDKDVHHICFIVVGVIPPHAAG